MKDKTEKTEKIERTHSELRSVIFDQKAPFVFEEDKDLIEELSRYSRYIHGLFAS